MHRKQVYLEVELAIDYGKPSVTATYSLEGDGPLIISNYDIVETIKSAIRTSDTPNVRGVIRRLSLKLNCQKTYLTMPEGVCGSGIDYFEKQLSTNLKYSLATFKAARLFSPQKL